MILARVKAVAQDEQQATADDLDYIIKEWIKLAENPELQYQAPKSYKRSERRASDAALLRYHSDEDLEGAFDTLSSLRDVDVESHLYLER